MLVLLTVTAFSFLNSFGHAFMPEVCFSNSTVNGGSGVCCPTPKGASLACGGPGYGQCERIYIQNDGMTASYSMFNIDDRFNWPSKFFNSLCKCEGNFFGIACNECYFGWAGPKCDQRISYTRRNIMSYTPKEKEMFVSVVAQMPKVMTEFLMPIEADATHSDPMKNMKWEPANLHYYIAAIHRYTSRSTLFDNPDQCKNLGFLDNNHNSIGFITWHRMLMFIWERELRKIAIDLYGWKDFAIPYWDWIDATKCDPCTNDLVGAPGPWENGVRRLDPASPFYEWTEYCSIPKDSSLNRCYGCHATWPNFRKLNRDYYANSFPTTTDLEFTLSKKTYHLKDQSEAVTKCRSFREALEGFCGRPNDNSTLLFMHNRVHNMNQGSMCCSATASNDPLFILHHSQMDRIWQIWYRYYKPRPTEYPNHSTPIGNCRECNLIGFIPVIRHVDMFTDLFELGVDYDNYNFGKQGFTGEKFLKNGPYWPESYWDDMYNKLHPENEKPMPP